MLPPKFKVFNQVNVKEDSTCLSFRNNNFNNSVPVLAQKFEMIFQLFNDFQIFINFFPGFSMTREPCLLFACYPIWMLHFLQMKQRCPASSSGFAFVTSYNVHG